MAGKTPVDITNGEALDRPRGIQPDQRPDAGERVFPLLRAYQERPAGRTE